MIRKLNKWLDRNSIPTALYLIGIASATTIEDFTQRSLVVIPLGALWVFSTQPQYLDRLARWNAGKSGERPQRAETQTDGVVANTKE